VRLRWRYVALLAVLGAATAVLPAVASSETSPTVEAVNEGSGGYYGESHRWSPAQVTAMAGGVVTFSNPTTVNHGVEWVGGPAKPTCSSGVPVGTSAEASGKQWSGTCTFTQPGVYTFYCTVHGPEMTGAVTVSANGSTTTTMTTMPSTTTTTTPAPKPTPPSGPPFAGPPSLPATQHGTSVRGSIDVSAAGAGDSLEIDLLAGNASIAKVKRAKPVRVGRLLRRSVSAGRQSFVVALDAQARRSLKRRHRLALTVKIVLTSPGGEASAVTRSVVQHP
jgi:plastocyanin